MANVKGKNGYGGECCKKSLSNLPVVARVAGGGLWVSAGAAAGAGGSKSGGDLGELGER